LVTVASSVGLGFRGLGLLVEKWKQHFVVAWNWNLKMFYPNNWIQNGKKIRWMKKRKKGKTQCRHYISMVSFTSKGSPWLIALIWKVHRGEGCHDMV
jgi:hypothetical protein